MSDLFLEVNNFLTNDEIEVVEKNILTPEFPWFYQERSTSDLFPFFSHVVNPRCNDEENDIPISNSSLSHFVKPIVERFCEKHLGRPLKKLYRSAFNATYGWNLEYPFIEPHVDHFFDHYNLIIYLNDDFEGGDTLLFDKYLCEGLSESHYSVDDYNQVNILHSIKSEKYKALCFDGKLFHGLSNIKSGKRRVILVTTFI